jgi:hypothetical protein
VVINVVRQPNLLCACIACATSRSFPNCTSRLLNAVVIIKSLVVMLFFVVFCVLRTVFRFCCEKADNSVILTLLS